jgi:hypothetical protein
LQVKSKTSVRGTALLKSRVMRISRLSDSGLKEFFCICLLELGFHTEICSRAIVYFMVDVSEQNIQSDGMIHARIWKECWPILKYYPRICMERLRNMIQPRQNSW